MAIALSSLNVPPPYALKRVGLVKGTLDQTTSDFIDEYECDQDYALCTWKPIYTFAARRYYNKQSRVLETIANLTNFTLDVTLSNLVVTSFITHFSPPNASNSHLTLTRDFFDSFVPQLDDEYILPKGGYLYGARGEGSSNAPDFDRTLLPHVDDTMFIGAHCAIQSNTIVEPGSGTRRTIAPYPVGSYTSGSNTEILGYLERGALSLNTGNSVWPDNAAFDSSFIEYHMGVRGLFFRQNAANDSSNAAGVGIGLALPSFLDYGVRSQFYNLGDEFSEDIEYTPGQFTSLLQDQKRLFDRDLGSFWMQRGQVLENFYGTVETYSLG